MEARFPGLKSAQHLLVPLQACFLMCKRDIPATASGGHCENWVNTQIVST